MVVVIWSSLSNLITIEAANIWSGGNWGTTFWSNYFWIVNIWGKLFLSWRIFILDIFVTSKTPVI